MALIPGRFAFVWIVCFSVSVNLLLLVVPFYSIEVFDRVLSSGSVETLVGLTVIAVGALAFSAAFDTFRNRLLSRFAVGLASGNLYFFQTDDPKPKMTFEKAHVIPKQVQAALQGSPFNPAVMLMNWSRDGKRVVSVGMAEHVGAALLPAYFGHAWRLLKPGGVMLNHAIGFAADVIASGLKFVYSILAAEVGAILTNTRQNARDAKNGVVSAETVRASVTVASPASVRPRRCSQLSVAVTSRGAMNSATRAAPAAAENTRRHAAAATLRRSIGMLCECIGD